MVASIHLLYQTAHHLLASIEVSNHSVSQRTDGTYVYLAIISRIEYLSFISSLVIFLTLVNALSTPCTECL